MATILSSSDTAPFNFVIISCTTFTTLNILSRVDCLQWAPELTDLFLVVTQGPGHSVFLKWVDLPLKRGVPEDASDLRCLGLPPHRTHLGWWGRKRIPFPLWSCVPSGISFSAAPPSRVCSPDNWQDGVFLLSPTGSCSMLGWKMCSSSRGTPCAGGRPRTTKSWEAVCNLPRRGRTAGSCGTA
jgi:hypothetical protein